MRRVSMQDLIAFGVRFLTSRGVPDEAARYLSGTVVLAEAYRLSTHGLAQFKAMDGAMGERINPEAEPEIVEQKGASALVDGEECFGLLAMKTALNLGRKMASQHGVGFVAVRNTSWVGALGVPLINAARDGYLVQAWAQTANCRDCAPFGGIGARLSTNPIAMAFPDGDGITVADFSTATMSMGAAHEMIRREQRTRTPRFLDKKGQPSGDPNVIKDGGTIMLAGGDTDGHKAFAMSLWIEALTALAGGRANDPGAPPRQSFSIMMLDPNAFAGEIYYRKEMRRFTRHVKSSRPRFGVTHVRLPGERGFASLADCRQYGIPLTPEKQEMLNGISEKNGLPNRF